MNEFYIKAQEVIKKYTEAEKKVVTAESCTGGLLSAVLTSVSGSSKVFERGYITYSNESKIELLDVDKQLIKDYGAVSREVSVKMAKGALKESKADISISITGMAGPARLEDTKKVGLVFITYFDYNKKIVTQKFNFDGNREYIRNKTVYSALNLLLSSYSQE